MDEAKGYDIQLVESLRNEGYDALDKTDDSGYGKFG